MKIDKLEERILSKPVKKDITVKELETYLTSKGFIFDRMADSAHYFYKHKTSGKVYSFAGPHAGQKHILMSYILNLQRLLREMEDEKNEKD